MAHNVIEIVFDTEKECGDGLMGKEYIVPKVGQTVFKNGKRIGKIVIIQEPDVLGIKLDNSEWTINLQFFLEMNRMCGDNRIFLKNEGLD